jgi:hypothetical protein
MRKSEVGAWGACGDASGSRRRRNIACAVTASALPVRHGRRPLAGAAVDRYLADRDASCGKVGVLKYFCPTTSMAARFTARIVMIAVAVKALFT